MKVYGAHFCKSDGTYKIVCYNGKAPPQIDNKTYFPTYRMAHRALIAKYEAWLREERAHLQALRRLKTEEEYHESLNITFWIGRDDEGEDRRVD